MFQIWQIEWVSEGEGVVGRRDDGGAGAPHSHQIPLGEIDIFLQLYFSRISLALKYFARYGPGGGLGLETW